MQIGIKLMILWPNFRNTYCLQEYKYDEPELTRTTAGLDRKTESEAGTDFLVCYLESLVL